VSIGSLNQEHSGSNVVSFAESVVGAAVRAAVKPQPPKPTFQAVIAEAKKAAAGK